MKRITNFWDWLVSFLPYRYVKTNSVVNKYLNRPLDFVDLKISKHEINNPSHLTKNRNKEPKEKNKV